MQFKQWLVVIMMIASNSFSADFDIGISIEPVGSAYRPKRRSLSNSDKNRLKTKVAQRYDLPENWLNLMNQNQLYYLEIQERVRDLDQNMITPNANKPNKAKGE